MPVGHVEKGICEKWICEKWLGQNPGCAGWSAQ